MKLKKNQSKKNTKNNLRNKIMNLNKIMKISSAISQSLSKL
jgi:hypothetical protein